jgi:site-specific DNA-methyltransferase (adenine-specific)
MKFYESERVNLYHGDCIEVMKNLPENSVDSIVTDPPYELGFMGKSWDSSGVAFNVDVWKEALRVLKPGGHLIAFSGSRTYHRMAVAIEDAGFEIRDQIMWIYGSGFPKSHDVSKGIDKTAGAEREVISEVPAYGIGGNGILGGHMEGATAKVTAPATDAAKQWQGWGTALKPAHEPMVLARKPLIGTVAANVLTYGTGGLNIDGARVASPDNDGKVWTRGGNGVNARSGSKDAQSRPQLNGESETVQPNELGRWPANVIHDGSDEVVELFPNTAGNHGGRVATSKFEFGAGNGSKIKSTNAKQDFGSAARFFYCAKASKRDRNEGLDEFPQIKGGSMSGVETREGKPTNHPMRQNHHPTVKPTALMRYLINLVTPPGGTVLDPFMGSGSTGKAAMYKGFEFIGIEMTEEYLPIAKARIEFAINEEEGKL